MKPKYIFQVLPLCLLFTACSEQKQIRDIHDASVEMNETTQKMDKKTQTLADASKSLDEKMADFIVTSKNLDKKISSLSDTTDELYDTLRQGDTLQLRRQAYDAVLKGANYYKKLAEAAKYFMAFEIQLWNSVGQDITEEKRDVLAEQAAVDFFLEIEGLADRSGKVNVTAQPDGNDINSKENRDASFNAFAMTVDQMNRKQLPNLAKMKTNFKPVSIMTLMEDALLAKPQINAGSAQLGTKGPYIREILMHEAKAIQLLQARYSLFPMLFIDFITQIGGEAKTSGVTGAIDSLFSKLKAAKILYWDKEIEFNLNSLSASQLDYLQKEVLQKAIHSRDFLRQIHVKPVLDPIVAALLKKLTFKFRGEKNSALTNQQNLMMQTILNLKEVPAQATR